MVSIPLNLRLRPAPGGLDLSVRAALEPDAFG
jgi:hypothetical protein